MSRQPIWQEIYNRFDPFLPAAEHAWRADRPRSPAGDIIKLLRAPFDGTRVLVTGTTGTGKSTELLRIAEACSGEDFVVVLDLQRHFSEVVGDEQALQNISSWEVVYLAGVALVRAAQELVSFHPIPQDYLDGLTNAWEKAAKATDTLKIARETPASDMGNILYFLASLEAARGDPAAPATAREGLRAILGFYAPDHPMGRDLTVALERIAQGSTP